jgi:hypothetical protein
MKRFFEKNMRKSSNEDVKIWMKDAQTSTFNFLNKKLLNNYIQNTIIYLEDPKQK